MSEETVSSVFVRDVTSVLAPAESIEEMLDNLGRLMNLEYPPPDTRLAELSDVHEPLPWSANGKLVGRRTFGPMCSPNPFKSAEVKLVDPDEVINGSTGTEIIKAPDSPALETSTVGTCTIL